VFEIGKDLSSPAEVRDPLHLILKILGGVVVLPQAEIEKISGLDGWRLNLLAFSEAQRRVPVAKRREHFLGKPRIVPKFEGSAEVAGQVGQKFRQQ